MVVRPVRGVVLVRRPHARRYARLTAAGLLPVGSSIDARRGTLGLTSANGAGMQSGRFHDATFVVTQTRRLTYPLARPARSGRGQRWGTVLRLRGGSFAGCDADDLHRAADTGSAPTVLGSVARARPRRRRVVRRLWSSDSGGSWTTLGGDAAATVRGTVWLTADLCAGTYVYVKRGTVVVRDLATGRRVRLTAGHAYLARAPDRI